MLLTALHEALGVLWPRACAGCGALDVLVCAACERRVGTIEHREIDGMPLLVAAAYADEVRRLVLASKEDGARQATAVLGAALARLVDAAPPHDALVLAPSSIDGWVRRGFVPVRRLVRAAGCTGIELLGERDGQQKRRTAAARASASTSGFAVAARDRERTDGARCLLVDDVVTTGATMRAVARAVRDAGGLPVAAVAIARVDRKRRDAA